MTFHRLKKPIKNTFQKGKKIYKIKCLQNLKHKRTHKVQTDSYLNDSSGCYKSKVPFRASVFFSCLQRRWWEHCGTAATQRKHGGCWPWSCNSKRKPGTLCALSVLLHLQAVIIVKPNLPTLWKTHRKQKTDLVAHISSHLYTEETEHCVRDHLLYSQT